MCFFTTPLVVLDGVYESQEVKFKIASFAAPQIEARLRHAKEMFHLCSSNVPLTRAPRAARGLNGGLGSTMPVRAYVWPARNALGHREHPLGVEHVPLVP